MRHFYAQEDTDVSDDPAKETAAKQVFNQIQKEIVMH